MKAETRRAVDRLDRMLEVMSMRPLFVEVYVGKGVEKFTPVDFCNSDINLIRSLLKKLPAAEECLARGGMVKDWDGAWCREGDRVRFRSTSSDDFETGELQYDDSIFTWYVLSDRDKYFHELGDVYEWHKEENND